jgi:dihydropteroate synthase
MRRDIYLRPLGLYAAGRASGADEVWGGLRLARGWLDFTALEIIERSGGKAPRRIIGLGDFFERDWGRRTLNAADMFEALRAPRARLAGLAFDRPRLMGIVNVTPDSFSDGGRFATTQAAIDHALRLAEEGAEILDIGAESTRPGSDPVPLDEELRRLMPVLEGLAGQTKALLSVDTRKAEVMRRVAAAGTDMLNDVSALTHDPKAVSAAADTGLPIVLMHAQGDPKTMQENPHYDDALLDVFDYLEARIAACERAGIPRAKIVVDPGLGFGKTLADNLQLLNGVSLFHGLGVPVLVGASRKRFIGTLTKVETAHERVAGSIGAALAAAAQGVQILRVHDVAATRQALTVWEAANGGAPPPEMS